MSGAFLKKATVWTAPIVLILMIRGSFALELVYPPDVYRECPAVVPFDVFRKPAAAAAGTAGIRSSGNDVAPYLRRSSDDAPGGSPLLSRQCPRNDLWSLLEAPCSRRKFFRESLRKKFKNRKIPEDLGEEEEEDNNMRQAAANFVFLKKFFSEREVDELYNVDLPKKPDRGLTCNRGARHLPGGGRSSEEAPAASAETAVSGAPRGLAIFKRKIKRKTTTV